MKPALAKTSIRKKFYPQWLTGAGVFVIMLEIGIMCGWSSPYLARLSQPDSPLHLTTEQTSWIASLLNLGRFLGAICGAVVVNYLGNKRSLMIAVIPIGCCWIFTFIATSYVWLYAARLSGGFGLGMTYSCFALYVGEVALPEIRGAIVSLAMGGGGSVGVVVSSICGSYLSMELSAVIYVVPCVAVALLFFWLPDTPHYLVKIHDYERAKRAIEWYQPGADTEKEIDVIKDLLSSSSNKSFFSRVQQLKLVPVRKAAILLVVLFTFMQITGLNSVVFYMETIIRRSGFALIEPADAVICVNAFGIAATIVSMCLIDKCGRKLLLLVSCVGVTISMAILGVNSYLIGAQADVTDLQWLPILAVLLFIVSYYLGLMIVPSTMLSEIFPSDVKCVAGCVASLVGALWSFAATRSFQPLIDLIGEPFVFWIHALLAAVLIPYALLFMPETKGKTLQEIQNKLIRI